MTITAPTSSAEELQLYHRLCEEGPSGEYWEQWVFVSGSLVLASGEDKETAMSLGGAQLIAHNRPTYLLKRVEPLPLSPPLAPSPAPVVIEMAHPLPLDSEEAQAFARTTCLHCNCTCAYSGERRKRALRICLYTCLVAFLPAVLVSLYLFAAAVNGR